MPRILGVDIPRDKKTKIALTYVYGIGPHIAMKILSEAKIDTEKRAKDLTEKEVSQITSIIQNSVTVEGDLRREVATNVKRLMDIRAYRGMRHARGLPARGQRTSTNARTRKGKRKVIGGLNKKAPSPK